MDKTKLPVKHHGIVTAVEPKSIESRTETLVKTGTNRLVAVAIATQAAEQQALRDAKVKEEIVVRQRVLTEAVASTKLTKTPVPNANAPTEVVVPTYADTTIEKLRAFATEHAFEIDPKLTVKKDIYDAIVAAHAEKFPVAD